MNIYMIYYLHHMLHISCDNQLIIFHLANGMLYSHLYRNLQYKYGISLKQRGKSPFIQHVKESEWDKVIKVFSAMCEAYGQSPTDMFKQTAISR